MSEGIILMESRPEPIKDMENDPRIKQIRELATALGFSSFQFAALSYDDKRKVSLFHCAHMSVHEEASVMYQRILHFPELGDELDRITDIHEQELAMLNDEECECPSC